METAVALKMKVKKMGAEMIRLQKRVDAFETQFDIMNMMFMKIVENIQGAKEEVSIIERSRKMLEKEIEELFEKSLQEESICEELLCSAMETTASGQDENGEDKDKEHVLWSEMEIGVGAQVEVVEVEEGCDSENVNKEETDK